MTPSIRASPRTRTSERGLMDKKVNFQIRQATQQDGDILVALLSSDTSGLLPNNPSCDIPGTLKCPAAHIYVVESKDSVLGTITASWNGRNGEMRYLWIAPHIRGTRLSRKILLLLVNQAFRYLESVEMTRALVFVRQGPESARQTRLYTRKFGAIGICPIQLSIPIPKSK